LRTGFGENYSQTGTQDLSFTGQNQDAESSGASGVGGLYDFLYRKQSPVQGRWLSPDPAELAAANPSDPQSWNRYAYVGNRSLSLTDPLGLVEMPCDPWSLSCPGDPNPGPCNVSDPSCGGPCYPTVSLCIPDPPGGLGDGGGGGGGGYAAGTQRTGGIWPGNQTLGLPGGLNQSPLNLGSLFGLSPGTQCGDFIQCGSLEPGPLSYTDPGTITIPRPLPIPWWEVLEVGLWSILLAQTGDNAPPGSQQWCTYTGEFQERSVDHQWKFCSYSCPSGQGKTLLWPVGQACPSTTQFSVP
jgi:RHS repeat-associated protein